MADAVQSSSGRTPSPRTPSPATPRRHAGGQEAGPAALHLAVGLPRSPLPAPQLAVDASHTGGKYAAVVSNACSKDECAAIIDAIEGRGFEPALLNIGGGQQQLNTAVRRSERVIVDDDVFAVRHSFAARLMGGLRAWGWTPCIWGVGARRHASVAARASG